MINKAELQSIFGGFTDEVVRNAFITFMCLSGEAHTLLEGVDHLRLQRFMIDAMGGQKVVSAYLERAAAHPNSDLHRQLVSASEEAEVEAVLLDQMMEEVEDFVAIALIHLDHAEVGASFGDAIEESEGTHLSVTRGLEFVSYGIGVSRHTEIIQFLQDLTRKFASVDHLFDLNKITFISWDDGTTIQIPWRLNGMMPIPVSDAARRLDRRAFWSYY